MFLYFSIGFLNIPLGIDILLAYCQDFLSKQKEIFDLEEELKGNPFILKGDASFETHSFDSFRNKRFLSEKEKVASSQILLIPFAPL